MTPLMHGVTARHVQQFIDQPKSSAVLIGEKGSGKSYLAQWIAAKLLDTTANAKAHLHIIDAAVTGIDEVRDLQKKLTLHVPGDTAVRRVVVFTDFDKFGHEAQNALLKTLEEPPQDTVLLLTVSDKQRVLPTIFSRVPLLPVRALTLDQASGYDASAEVIRSAFYLSGGAPGLFVGLCQDSEDHELVRGVHVAKQLLQAERYERIGRVDSLIKDKNVSPLVVVDALVRILQATYAGARKTAKPSAELAKHQTRVAVALAALSDLRAGVHQKLVLTRLFLGL